MPPKPAMPGQAATASPLAGKAALGLISLGLGLVVGYGAGRVSTGTPVNPFLPPKEATESPAGASGPAGLQPPPAPTESVTISGSVVSATENALTFDADLSFFDPLGEGQLPKRRKANLTDSTEIVRLIMKSPEESAQEQVAFAKVGAEISANGAPPAPPSPFKEVRISATDIAAGETISVIAAEDILKAETFDAVRIVVLPKPSALPPEPTPPPPAPPTTP